MPIPKKITHLLKKITDISKIFVLTFILLMAIYKIFMPVIFLLMPLYKILMVTAIGFLMV